MQRHDEFAIGMFSIVAIGEEVCRIIGREQCVGADVFDAGAFERVGEGRVQVVTVATGVQQQHDQAFATLPRAACHVIEDGLQRSHLL